MNLSSEDCNPLESINLKYSIDVEEVIRSAAGLISALAAQMNENKIEANIITIRETERVCVWVCGWASESEPQLSPRKWQCRTENRK